MAAGFQRSGRCRLRVGEVTCRKFFDSEGALDPRNVDCAVHPRAVRERYRNGRDAVSIASLVERVAICPTARSNTRPEALID